jgi:AraC family transcriptional activator of pobA
MPFSQLSDRAGSRSGEAQVRAESFRAALQARTLGLAGLDEAHAVRAIHLERGEARLLRPDDDGLPLGGPLVGWFPWQADMRLEIGAGAQGCHLVMGRAALARMLARSPEAAELRFLPDRSVILHLSQHDAAASSIAACFSGIMAETLRPGQMSTTMVEAFLRILLVHLFRGQPHELTTGHAPGGGRALSNRFIALVDGHLHDRWSVSRYAEAMGLSRDRLTDICMRAHGRPPGQLIRERLALEARIYLEQSALAIDQIAGVLGFSGASQFNRFFRSMTGTPPGRYRDRQRALSESATQRNATLFNWP